MQTSPWGGWLETAALPQVFQIAASQNNLLVSRELVVTKSFLADVSSVCLIFKALLLSGLQESWKTPNVNVVCIMDYCYFVPNTWFYNLYVCVCQFCTVFNADGLTLWPWLCWMWVMHIINNSATHPETSVSWILRMTVMRENWCAEWNDLLRVN